MTAAKDDLVRLIWGSDPFATLEPQPERIDLQGWNSAHPYLIEAIDQSQPKLIVEIGVWKGLSVMTMAQHLRARGMNAAVLAVDTWLGSSEHWRNPEWFAGLRCEAGYPTMFRTFTANLCAYGLQTHVVPLPLDSINAAVLLQSLNVTVDVIHLDAGHDVASVTNDLKLWWPLLASGGVLIGDDYHPDGGPWPGVREGFHGYFGAESIENRELKCILRKGADGEPVFHR